MKLLFLGTGAGMPSKQRNVSSLALMTPQQINDIWLFDCGEATQHQILQTTIKPRKISKIFITHMHGDHIFGLPGLLSSRSFLGGTDPLTIYGPKGIQKYIMGCLEASQTHLPYSLNIVEITAGKILSTEWADVYAETLTHGITSFGFKIVEKDRPGTLLVDKLIEKGIQPGPIFSKIKENDVTIMEDGKKIYREDFVGPTKPGRTICIMGDTKNPISSQTFVKYADVLVHEATFSSEHEDLANEYNHSTVKEVAQLAHASKVKQLILTHISSRYQTKDILKMEREAQSIFRQSTIAMDLQTYSIQSS